MSKLSDRIAQLSPQKREILRQKLQLNQEKPIIPTIQSQSRDTNTFPLSFAQERLWFLNQLEPDNSFYNQPTALSLTGELNLEVLKQALREIIRRHENLRTNFVITDGKPAQVIKQTVNFEIPILGLTGILLSDRDQEIRKLAEQEAEKPFNLEKDSLLRVTLLKLSTLEHIVLFTTHHIISDGWSTGILVQELATLYQAFLAGEPSPLPELPIQYADFAVWQREWLQGDTLNNQLNYWKQQLGGNPPILDLPTDYRRPNKLTYQGATESFVLSESLTNALKTLSQTEGVTLFMTLLAAFKVLLHRYSHQDDIVVGTPIANRNRAEIEGLIGFFVNTLVLRTNLEDNPSFKELLQRVKQVTLGAYSNQDLPFEQLVEELKPERHLNRNPLFDVMFTLQNAPKSELTLPELTLSSIKEESPTAIFDLSLDMFESAFRLEGVLEYSTDLFEPTTMKRFAGHFQALLEAIVAQPETVLSELSLLTAKEKNQLLVEWNNTQVKYPQDQCIHQLFEEQVAKTPDAVAIVFENQQLTYQELNTRANQLAHYIKQNVLGSVNSSPEILIGICVERSLEMVIGLIAILKAGGAYIPLDPNYPEQRLSFILEQANVSLLLSEQKLLPLLSQSQADVICLDSEWQKINQQDIYNPIDKLSPNNLAYLIYTSGSTGKPKGVQITHTAVVNFLTSMSRTPGLTATDILLSVTTISFDIAALEIYLPLIVGARLVLVSREVAMDGNKLSQQLALSQGNVMQATPATWRLLLDAQWQGNQDLKILCGGEALDRSLANQLLSHTQEVWNLYGPTETTIWSAAYQVKEVVKSAKNIIPIGTAIANTQFYLLDQQQQLVPVGVVGELYIGGVGLARGYFNRPDLTNEKFILNPFGENQAQRLYKTGDKARYLPNGELEYISRIDHQVKIRGFRIELREIEVSLGLHPAIKGCVIISHEDKRLVAYYVAREQLDNQQLREYLKSKLPDYMIPTAWVQLDALPLTPNGKVDRNSLPIPDFTPTANYTAPSTPQEEILANIWQEVLNVEQVGIDDNFFELGGHSLLATQVVSKIRQSLSIELPLRSLFEFPTVAELTHQLQGNSSTEVPSIQPVAREGDLPLSFAQQRLWFLAQLEPDSPTYNIPEALRLQGKLDINVLTQTLEAIVQRHEVLRTNFTIVADEPVQVIHSKTNLELPIIDLSHLSPITREQEVTKLTEQEVLKPFDLEQDSLLRVTLIRLDKLEHIVLFTTHHIISDGWSTGILVQEVATLYQAFLAGKPSPLPELPIQYADYAVWQRDYLQGDVLDRQLNYWKQKLGGKLPLLKLPYQQQQPAVKTNRSLSHDFKLSQELSQALRQISRETETTLFMVILATLNTLLYRYTQQDDIVVGADIANRNRAETEGLIGFFVNLLVLRCDLSGYPSFKELLGRVKEITLSAYAHQDLPFDRLVQELQSSRQADRTSLFQVLLVMDNVPTVDLELPNLTITEIEEVDNYAKFDLVLFIAETESGMVGSWQYNSNLFEAKAIAKLADSYITLLQDIVSQPDTRINNLAMSNKVEIAKEKSKFSKFLKVKPKAINLPSSEELIQTSFLQQEQNLPLVITPDIQDLDIFDWVKNEKQFLESKLLKYGAILFRNCQLNSIADFERLAQTICPSLFGNYGDLPRTGVSDKVYGSTPYPADKTILFHNESSHLHCYPQKIWFYCVQPAQEGGETPIVDCRQIYQLLDTQLREKLEQKQLMYVRNYIEGLDVSWQDFFHTEDKSVVEKHCLQSEMEFEWLPNNGLRTSKKRPAIAQHPITKEKTFFNQIQLHHISYLDSQVRESLLSVFSAENLPRNVYYGDASPLQPEDIEAINRAYEQATKSFPWQKGDVLMLDNMLTAHSRNPYKGDRKIVVAMGEMIDSTL